MRTQNKLLPGTIRNNPSPARLVEFPALNPPQSNRTANPAVTTFRNLLELTMTAPFSLNLYFQFSNSIIRRTASRKLTAFFQKYK
jgi:hypothetical protein